MSRYFRLSTGRALAFALTVVLAAGPALADKPSWAGEKGGKGHKDKDEHREAPRGQDVDRGDRGQGRKVSRIEHFNDPHRGYVREYYDGQFRAGRCPPGLAKKHNGCMPPGQAKKWEVGHALPRDVRYYEVPAPLVVQLGQPPAGYRYVRVNDDILLLAMGTRMVVDAIRSLGR